jgi:hypothetical protein
MKTIKTSELLGPALDWLVAQCEGVDYCDRDGVDGIGNEFSKTAYSTDPAQAWPIIEREEIAIIPDDGWWIANLRYAPDEESSIKEADGSSTTPLIAAMRCYVSSKLGDEVEVPEELLL